MKRETTKTDAAPLPAGLPKALRPWSPAFQHMPEPHLRLIGDLMAQLNPLLRETFEIHVQSYGEFNGYDGMAVRGEIERLLPSEWLWRELAPVEFLRRFAEQELLFHRPSFESPTDERTHLVAIDCGPGMLGRPRLVALAALLCLNAIAREQSARLLWIAPHAEVKGWQPMLTQKDIRAFLLSANPLPLRAGQLEELVQALPEGAHGSELMLWIIGAAPLAMPDETIKTNQIVITERMTLTPDGAPIAEARVDFHAHAGRRKDAALVYPKEEDCVALLREPYRAAPVIRGPIETKPRAEGDANPSWAPREVVLLDDPWMAILRVKEGILGLRVSASGQLEDPLLIRLEYDNLLGLHWGREFLHLALTRRYNTFSSLRLKRLRLNGSGQTALEELADFRLEEDAPPVIDKHPRNALPPLLKPGRRFRLLALTAKGAQYVLSQHAAERHAQIPQLALIGYRDGWAFILPRGLEGRRLVARNLATSQCFTFALPDNADVEGLDDIVYWPEVSHAGNGWMLMARCSDGHWRGGRGRPNMHLDQDFPDYFVDIDLSHLGRVLPLGSHPTEKGASVWRFWLWSPEDGSVHRCNFAAYQNCQIDRLDISFTLAASHYSPGAAQRPRLPATLSKSFLFTWGTNSLGHVVKISGGYLFDDPEEQALVMPSHDVEELIARARCLSA